MALVGMGVVARWTAYCLITSFARVIHRWYLNAVEVLLRRDA
jgi:hypothetical protein